MSPIAGHQISEVSARTGFSASTLRFYEGAGLVEPARTAAGYRVYDDRAVERLQFIARAKDLGLSLDDIGELLPVWEGDQCADVAGPLAGRVAEKVDETRARITELTAFAAELEDARRRLTHEIADGPCGDSCACSPAPGSGLDSRIAVALGDKPVPAYDDGPAPIACTLTVGDAVDRVTAWAELLATQTGQPRVHADGQTASVTVSFAPDATVAVRAAELAAAEQACCAFIDFDISISRNGIELIASTRLEAAPIVHALLGLPA